MQLSFYRVKEDYCNFLRIHDPCVPYTMEEKASRPFVGIVIHVNHYEYYAPLSSPKSKHLKMKNQVDFLKINGGVWGAINFNNMIPVHNHLLTRVEINIIPTDSKNEIDYKNLLKNQLSWCNSNRERIVQQAEKLYRIITDGTAREELKRRCCHFSEDERQLETYCIKQKIPFRGSV